MSSVSPFRPLAQHALAHLDCHVLGTLNPPEVHLTSPALLVMTDLARMPAATIAPDAAVEDALQSMVIRGVRLLLVADDDGRVQGMVTAADLQGERPVVVSLATGVSRNELLVQAVMTPLNDLDALTLEQVRHASVGEVVETLKAFGSTHALVVAPDAAGRHSVVGLFSAAQVARQLGMPIQTHEVARTFAQIESLFAHH